MVTAFAYARVSTKEQAAKGNSIPEQIARVQRYAEQNDIQIVQTYQDSDSAFHDTREQFQAMIEDAIHTRPAFIISDDSSRFARTRRAAIETKQKLRSHGINLRFVNEPYVDPKTVSGLWLEGIQEIKNEATSREIAFHAWKGMSHNIQNRDPETGWCYKNGGRAPFGYRIEYVNRGEQHGRPLLKSYWVLDPTNAPIAREIIVDMYTQRKMSYQEIRDELNQRGIPSPKGGYWPASSIVEMLKENRLHQYTGTAIWNKEAPRDSVGQKYRPQDEWITVDEAHPAIITMDELTAGLARKRSNRQTAKYGAAKKSHYLLTGVNFEGKPMFTCSQCGCNVIGYGNTSVNWRRYVCGANRMRGHQACNNDWRLDANWLESRLVVEIEQRFTTPERVDELVKSVSDTVSTKNRDLDKTVTSITAKIRECDTQIQRLLDAIKSGIDPTLISHEVNHLQKQKNDLSMEQATLKRSFSEAPKVDTNALTRFFNSFSTAYANATNEEKRELLRTFIRRIELCPETKEIRVEFYSDNTVQSIGVGEPYHT